MVLERALLLRFVTLVELVSQSGLRGSPRAGVIMLPPVCCLWLGPILSTATSKSTSCGSLGFPLRHSAFVTLKAEYGANQFSFSLATLLLCTKFTCRHFRSGWMWMRQMILAVAVIAGVECSNVHHQLY